MFLNFNKSGSCFCFQDSDIDKLFINITIYENNFFICNNHIIYFLKRCPLLKHWLNIFLSGNSDLRRKRL